MKIEDLILVAVGIGCGVCASILIHPELFTEVKIKTVTEYIQKKENIKTDKKTTIVRKNKKKDGSVITTTTTINERKDQNNTSNETNKITERPLSSTGSHYSLGISTALYRTMVNSFQFDKLMITGGIRLGNTPIWLEGGYMFNNTINAGVRLEF